MAHHPSYTMAGLLAAGGVTGYVKGRSTASLVAGLGFAAIFGLSGYQIQQGDFRTGHTVACVASIILAGVMGRRVLTTGKMMPAGAIAGAGAASAVYQGFKLYDLKKLGY